MIDTGPLLRRWRGWDVTVRDSPAAVLLLLLSVPTLATSGTQFGDLPTRAFDGWALVAVLLECVPMATRRRWPGASIMVTALGFGIDQALSYHTIGGTALVLGMVSAGIHVERHRRPVMALLTVGFVGLAVFLHQQGASDPFVVWLLSYLLLAAAWAIGSRLRSARTLKAERQRHIAESVRTAERTRIARELHDIVTHHVTAMVYQAEAARYLAADPARLDESLRAVTGTGRQAIADLRHLLDLLNPDHDTSGRKPTIGSLDTLLEQTRNAGQPVDFVEQGTPTDTAGSGEFVTYRVVQEALTNALKYAHGQPTAVRVSYGEKRIMVLVKTLGTTSTAGPGGSGRGLSGLRERVETLGGTFDARFDDEGFLVEAEIPA
ncbi:sensor histidine kinase [Micromonospora sp. NPDC049175]|uniref:sensor histidine kinase n=1 Tax=Micromonospora sp. NPDC049175 TaxID=3364266 RepID=UPI00371097F1